MNARLKNIPINLIITAVILLVLIVFVNSAQNTLGRYMTSLKGNLDCSFNSKQSFGVSLGEWSETTGKQSVSINISNSGDAGSSLRGNSARIRLYIPNTNDLLSVIMKLNNSEYTAVISEVREGTAVYNLYGKGSICCFYGSDGKEIQFDLSTSDPDGIEATLTVLADTSIDTTGIKIMIEPINSQGNGGN